MWTHPGGAIWKQQWVQAQKKSYGTRLQPAHSGKMGLRKVSGNSKGTWHYTGKRFLWSTDVGGGVHKERTIAWLMTEYSLFDAHYKLNTGPYPRTYRHGTRRIDQIYVSDQLLVKNILLQTTIEYFDSFFTSDHRPVLIDIDVATYFGSDTVEGVPRHVRILHCGDPRLLKTFLIAALTGVWNQKLDDNFVYLVARMRVKHHATDDDKRDLNSQ